MSRVYSIDVKLYATAYIKADSPEEAIAKARDLTWDSPDISDSDGTVPISGLPFHDPDLPDVSLSPAMTIHGPDKDAAPDLVHED